MPHADPPPILRPPREERCGQESPRSALPVLPRILASALLALTLAVLPASGLAEPHAEDAPAYDKGPEERLEEIRRRVQAAVVYPAWARKRGIEGTSRIEFRVGPDGHPLDLFTVDSSGSALLDAAALDGARDAGRLPAFYGRIRIPVVFALN
jgi:TonB family protein